jgi:hypothetical protein
MLIVIYLWQNDTKQSITLTVTYYSDSQVASKVYRRDSSIYLQNTIEIHVIIQETNAHHSKQFSKK